MIWDMVGEESGNLMSGFNKKGGSHEKRRQEGNEEGKV